MIDAQI